MAIRFSLAVSETAIGRLRKNRADQRLFRVVRTDTSGTHCKSGGSLAEEPKIVIELKALRYLLERKRLFLETFDEFIQHGEWELALHVVCDVFYEPDAPLLDEAAFTRIEELHRVMKIDDECCRDLSQIRSARA